MKTLLNVIFFFSKSLVFQLNCIWLHNITKYLFYPDGIVEIKIIKTQSNNNWLFSHLGEVEETESTTFTYSITLLKV